MKQRSKYGQRGPIRASGDVVTSDNTGARSAARFDHPRELIDDARRNIVTPARPRPGVTRRARRMRAHEQRITVAIEAQVDEREHVAARLALLPQRLPRSRPEVHDAGLARQAQRLVIHPREHQDCAGCRILYDRWYESPLVELRIHADTLHAPVIPVKYDEAPRDAPDSSVDCQRCS